MAQPAKFNINYPFGNPHRQNSEDAESYHSITIDSKKLHYFDQFTNQSISKISDKMQESNLKRKSPLPPLYPYEQVKKLKQSFKFQNKPKQISDNEGFNDTDSFHTANEFQSICYEEGDFQKIIREAQELKYASKMEDQKNILQSLEQYKIQKMSEPNYIPKVESMHNCLQKEISYQKNHYPSNSFKQISFGGPEINKKHDYFLDQKLKIQQSNALDGIEIEKLENAETSGQKYEGFEETNRIKQNEQRSRIQEKNEEEREIQISQIENALNASELIDQQILELTKQLQNIQSSQELLQKHHQFSEQCLRQQEILKQRYFTLQSKLKNLQSTQKNFNSQISNMHHLIKKTQQNNLYLEKEIQFFKQKSKAIEEKQRFLEEKEKKFNDKQIYTSENYSFCSGYQKLKPKTFQINPKKPNNQALQSRRYKELTFEYCSRNENCSNEDQWHLIDIDSKNTPPQFKLIYSFQHYNTILVVRLVELISNQSNRLPTDSKKFPGQGSFTKKNYQYLMDFAHNKYENQQKKLQSLSKELIVNLNQQRYLCKEFTKKIQIFLLICENETYVELVKFVPLPNPIVFYIESRFNFVEIDRNHNLNQQNQENRQQIEKQTENNSGLKKDRGGLHFKFSRALANLSKFMKTYIIRIEHMVDIESIQKLMKLNWINTQSNEELKYFTIKAQEREDCLTKQTQLFYVKLKDCILQNTPESNSLDQKHRYSLVFIVGSTSDNDLLVDLIEFLTFLTIY